jgi:hypothetical protein
VAEIIPAGQSGVEISTLPQLTFAKSDLCAGT